MMGFLRVDVFHNILWSKYKGVVFSDLYACTKNSTIEVDFFQIAETEKDRMGLSGVDLAYHSYPFKLIFNGAYDDVPISQRIFKLFALVFLAPRYDLIVLPGYHKLEYWAMLLAAILRRMPCAVFCDSTANDRPRSPMRALAKRFFFGRCQGFFCYGERSRQYLMMHGAPSSRVFHRVQAAALPLSYDAAQVSRLRLEQLARVEDPVLLYVGRLSPEKDLFCLLEAFRRLNAIYPNVRLHFIGSGPQRAELEAFTVQASISGQVRFLGGMTAEQLADHYLTATAFVLPSTSEPWGLVVNEALSYGCPVVVSDACGCMPELVIDHKTGFSFRAGDVEDLVRALETLFSPNTDRVLMSNFCLELISGFTPRHAAMQIVHGVKAIVSLN